MHSWSRSQVGFLNRNYYFKYTECISISAENGFYIKSQGEDWQQVYDNIDFSWKPTVKEVNHSLS